MRRFLLLLGLISAPIVALAGPNTLPYPSQTALSLNHPNVFMVPQVSSPPIQFQNGGVPIGIAFTFNCSTGLTCTLTNGVIVATASGSGTIAIPATVSGATSGGIPCFDSTTDMNTSGAISAGVLIKGGGAGACVGSSTLTDNGTRVIGTEPFIVPVGSQGTSSFGFSDTVNTGFYERSANIWDWAVTGTSTPIEWFLGGIRQGSNGVFGFSTTSNQANNSFDTAISRSAAGLLAIGTGASGNTSGFSKAAQSVAITSADVTCGTSGTISDCTAATTITGLTFTLPLIAKTWTVDCNLIVGQATGTSANQWLFQTATNGATNSAGAYMMDTAAAVIASGATTGQAATTTAFQIGGNWTLGATGTKMPVHLWGTFESVSASGTVLNIQVINPTNADLLTIYRGSACWLY